MKIEGEKRLKEGSKEKRKRKIRRKGGRGNVRTGEVRRRK